jgi:hypothetical protein
MGFFCVPAALLHKPCLRVEGVRQLDRGLRFGHVTLGPICVGADEL